MAFAACVLMPLLETKPSKTDQNEDGWKYIDFSDTLLREACDSIETRFSSKVITHFANEFKSSQRARELQIMLPRAKQTS